MKDSWLHSTQNVRNLTYLSVNTNYADNSLLVNNFFSVIMYIGENKITTTRIAYNLVDALSSTGGLASVITLFFTIITSRIQLALYY